MSFPPLACRRGRRYARVRRGRLREERLGARPPNLIETVAILGRLHAPLAQPPDPLQLILWENIGYLIDDEKRRNLFDAFGERIGFDAARIAAADDAELMPLAAAGGMRPEGRVERWRHIAGIVLEDCDGQLDRTLRSLPIAKARALLRRFPSIGEPGADKILLFAGIDARPCLESNGLRALARLGYFESRGAYAADYRAAIDVMRLKGRNDRDWLVHAWLVLREHGKALCKRTTPICWTCPLDEICLHVMVPNL
jgi:endonuclease III